MHGLMCLDRQPHESKDRRRVREIHKYGAIHSRPPHSVPNLLLIQYLIYYTTTTISGNAGGVNERRIQFSFFFKKKEKKTRQALQRGNQKI
jgi:hypothetical protein